MFDICRHHSISFVNCSTTYQNIKITNRRSFLLQIPSQLTIQGKTFKNRNNFKTRRYQIDILRLLLITLTFRGTKI